MAERSLPHVAIPTELEGFVADRVRSGRALCASDVVAEGLRLLADREGELEAMRLKIREGSVQLDRGEFADADEFFDRWERDLEERAARPRRSA